MTPRYNPANYPVTITFGLAFIVALSVTILKLGGSIAAIPLFAMGGSIVVFFALFESSQN